MALSGWMKCLRCTMFVVNLLFWLVGLCILGMALWLRFDPETESLVALDDNLPSRYYTLAYIFMAIGGLMTVVGFLGCYGAYQESKCLVITFFITLILVLVGEIGGGVYAYQQKEQVVDVIRDLIRGTIRNEYAVNSAQRSLIDYLQRKLECCGSDGPDDWVGIVVYDPDKGADIGVDEKAQINQAPASCCTPASLAASPDQCGVLSDSDYPNVWTVGCHEQLGVAVKDNLVLVIGIAVCIAILQIAVMVFTLTLCIGLSRTEYEPANIEKY